MTIRILLADDQPLVRAGIAMLLSAQDDMEIVGEAGDGVEAVELARRLLPDVVIMDLRMPRLDGVAATAQLTSDEFGSHGEHTAAPATVKVLALTTFHDDEIVYRALRAGASGFVIKDGVPAELVTAIREAHAGNAYLHPAVTRMVIADIATRPGPATPLAGRVDRLTNREREVLQLVAYGLTNREIAARLFLSEATVKTHVCRVLMKLEVSDRAQAVVVAYQARLVTPGDGEAKAFAD
jgi:DNA-binding NarL/FixJ family response regulator